MTISQDARRDAKEEEMKTMNADETKRTEEFIADDSEAEMTQPHPGQFPAADEEVAAE